MLELTFCANSHAAACLQPSADCPRTIVLRYTSCGCVYRAAQGSRTRARTSVLRYLAVARLCSDYRPALAAVRLLVCGSRKPHLVNGSIAPTITNTSVSAQATTPTEDSLCKGESSPFTPPLKRGTYMAHKKFFTIFKATKSLI